MEERNRKDIDEKLHALEKQIECFRELKYEETLQVYSGTRDLCLLTGLDEKDFYKIKSKIIEMLKECYNQKNDEMISLCQRSKMFVG